MLFLTKRAKHDFLASCARIRIGSLRLHTPEGEIFDFGLGTPAAEMQIHDWSVVTSVLTSVAARGDIALRDSYVAGLWRTSSIADLAEVALRNLDQFSGHAHAGFWHSLQARIAPHLSWPRSAASQCDAGNEFYQLWLDEGMTYSAAMFVPADNDLGRAQNRKHDRILNRMAGAGRVLDIGCGWGAFAERAADAGHQVTGLTLSPSQKGYADARLDGRAEIRLQDYRDSDGQFDGIVAIETLGPDWPACLAALRPRLAPHGSAVIQAIILPDAPLATAPLATAPPATAQRRARPIRHHAFPSPLLPKAAIAAHARRAGLQITDSHAFGADYARTCALWNDRLTRRSDRIRKLGHDEGFLRQWTYHLGVRAAAFATGQTDVVQLEFAHA
ncbi:MAG: class I SAM-dependent methyltransferase [bacterium]